MYMIIRFVCYLFSKNYNLSIDGRVSKLMVFFFFFFHYIFQVFKPRAIICSFRLLSTFIISKYYINIKISRFDSNKQILSKLLFINISKTRLII